MAELISWCSLCSDSTILLSFTIQVELAKQAVVLAHGSLSFKDLNQHARLVVRICGECLSLLGWDWCVSLNQLGHQATRSLQAHGQWSRIKQENIHCGEAPGSENCEPQI